MRASAAKLASLFGGLNSPVRRHRRGNLLGRDRSGAGDGRRPVPSSAEAANAVTLWCFKSFRIRAGGRERWKEEQEGRGISSPAFSCP